MLTRNITKHFIFSSRFTEMPFLSAISSGNNLISRSSHTDMKVPDFSKDMRGSVADPKTRSRDSVDSRSLFSNILMGTYITTGMYGVKAEVIRYVRFMDASADVLALAQIEINLAEIPEDKHVTFKWRGKPLFIWHRTDAAIKAVREVPLSSLRDPQEDADRVQDPKWLVVLGVCTHLGCVPISHQGDYGGYYCPCHGSHFDISGRTRQGPAPTNLDVPDYTITGTTLLVG